MQLDDFDAYFKDMTKDSAYKFSLQFEVGERGGAPYCAGGGTAAAPPSFADSIFQELKSVGMDLSHDAADLPINRHKNRYTNILPCESAQQSMMGYGRRGLTSSDLLQTTSAG